MKHVLLYVCATVTIASLCGCARSSESVRLSVDVSSANCAPMISPKWGDSLSGCHSLVEGKRAAIQSNSQTAWRPWISHSSRRRTLTILVPLDAARRAGPLPFDAYYSMGSPNFSRRDGCLGIVDRGRSTVVSDGRGRVKYSLRFRMVARALPVCGEFRVMRGSASIPG
jgi:hypothetical protein